jgi:hypothetical protein
VLTIDRYHLVSSLREGESLSGQQSTTLFRHRSLEQQRPHKKQKVDTASEEEEVVLHWFLLTSANLSQAAWGVSQVLLLLD